MADGPILIKRYPNRRYYARNTSKYVSLQEIEELIRRPFKTIPARIRPDEQMIGHTGFLVFARAVDREDRSAPAAESSNDR